MADVHVVLNVGGRRFETFRNTLLNLKNTRLSRLAKTMKPIATPSEKSLVAKPSQEYFFDRNATIFESILDFYRTGELHVPKQICGEAIHRELEFWDIQDSEVSVCCQIPLNAGKNFIEWNKRMKHKFMPKGPQWYKKKPEHVSSNWRKMQYTAWQAIENPFTSVGAMVYGMTYVVITIAKILITVLVTTPHFRQLFTDSQSYVDFVYNATTNPKERLYYTTKIHPTMSIVELACLSFFLVEIIVRFTLYPCKKMFLRNFVNVLDLCIFVAACLAFAGLRVFEHRPENWKPDLHEYMDKLAPAFILLAMVTLLRVVRVLMIVYQLPLMKVLILSLFESRHVLFLMIAILAVGTLIYGPLVYIADFFSSTSFIDIPIACWWAIVTMTTVGYGDHVPKTIPGYIVGCMCATTGIVLTALPVAVIGHNFNKLHAFAEENQRQLSRAWLFRRRFTVHNVFKAKSTVRVSSSASV